MKNKLILGLALILALFTVSATAGTNEFSKGSIFITPQVGLNEWTIPFGVNVEYGITPNIGLGATVMVWLWSDEGWSESVIAPMIEGAYHFTKLNVDKLDLYAGLGMGFAIYSFSGSGIGATGSSGIYVQPFVAARYYFTPTIAGMLKLGWGLGSWGSYGATIGVTFRLPKS